MDIEKLMEELSAEVVSLVSKKVKDLSAVDAVNVVEYVSGELEMLSEGIS